VAVDETPSEAPRALVVAAAVPFPVRRVGLSACPVSLNLAPLSLF
jgi:hypothetical protein